MKTEVVKITKESAADEYSKAVELLLNDEVVGMPTETVYGLAGNAYSPAAVAKIFEAKGRPQDNPLIVHISEFGEIYDLASFVPETAKLLAEKFWPGPLTMIIPKSEKVPYCVTAGLETVAVRCPSHPVANRLIKEAGVPIAAPSANLSGKPSPTKAEHVFRDMDGRIPLIIDGGECDEGVESTVILLASDTPRLLRPGNVTLSELESVLGKVDVDDAVLNPLKNGQKVSSPGMKYKHYSPNADVTVVKGSYEAFCEYVDSLNDGDTYAMVFNGEGSGLNVPYITYGGENYKEMSRRLFDALRELDDKGAKRCFVRCPDASDTDNLAVMNRLLRAAAFKVTELGGRKKITVGLTGKTGAGKSTVSEMFRERGAAVIDGDVLAAEVTSRKDVLDSLAEAFGEDVVEDGKLCKRVLARKAFSSPENTELLNSVTHPAINTEIKRLCGEYFKTCDVCVVDAAAIIESGFAAECDVLVTVSAPESVRLKRIMARDGITENDALLRIKAQKNDEWYESRSDYVIVNGDGASVLETAAETVNEIFKMTERK